MSVSIDRRTCAWRRVAVLVALGMLAPLLTGQAQQAPADFYAPLRFRHIGPVGNRISAAAGVPGNPNVYYVGAASGGVFKSTDAGAHWTPVFDDQQAQSIGSLAVARSDSNIVWAGTGEACVRSNISIGNGIYRSLDAGKTWTNMGLEKTGRIGRVIIHPRNPDIVFAAAMGHSYGPQQERGVYRTRDGGKTWERVLFVDENTGASDIAMDPTNPDVLFAGMWPLEIHTWGRTSGARSGGVHVSRDGGTTWKRLSKGLPNEETGKIALTVAPSSPNRVYALIETKDGGLWRSDDGGESWSLVNQDHTLQQRPHYYTHIAVSPVDADEVYFLAVQLSVSLDGGATIKNAPGGDHGDNHTLWVDPTNADRMILGNDGGVAITVNRMETFMRPQLPHAQMYHVAVDSQVPYNVYGNRQDGPSSKGPSNSRLSSGIIPIGMWHEVGGCESGFAVPDPVDNNIVWADCYEGTLDRYDDRTKHIRSVTVWPDNVMGWAAADIKYRFQWTTPIAISPHDHNQVYVGSQYVHQTNDAGQSWKAISPDLTLNDRSKQGPSGGLTPDNASVEYAPVVFAIAESPREKGLIWAGTNDGQLQVTRNGGGAWTNVTANLPGLPPNGTVSNIEPSRHDAGTAYVTFDLHQVNNRDPFVFKTTDYGRTWKSIASDLPRSVFSYTHCVREDPVRKGLLLLGTENGLYVSFNDGGNWVPFQSNLPRAPVHWMVVQEDFNDLVVATYGRGFWVLDDMSLLRQLGPETRNASAFLFSPRAAYRLRSVVAPMDQPEDPAAGTNPPAGAPITYHLKAATSTKPIITILDASGRDIRTIDGTGDAGLNRVWWDLRHESARAPTLRTTPADHPHVVLGRDGTRPLVEWNMQGRVGPLAAPGTYTVRVRAAGQELTQKLTIKKDPNSTGTEADIKAQLAVALPLRDDISTASDMIDDIEIVRRQLADLTVWLARGSDGHKVALSAARSLDDKFVRVASRLYQQQLSGARQDSLRWAIQLYAKMCALANDIGQSDFPPTSQQAEVYQLYRKQLADIQMELGTLMTADVAAFNKVLRDNNISTIFPLTARKTTW